MNKLPYQKSLKSSNAYPTTKIHPPGDREGLTIYQYDRDSRASWISVQDVMGADVPSRGQAPSPVKSLPSYQEPGPGRPPSPPRLLVPRLATPRTSTRIGRLRGLSSGYRPAPRFPLATGSTLNGSCATLANRARRAIDRKVAVAVANALIARPHFPRGSTRLLPIALA